MTTVYWGFPISNDLYRRAQAAITEVEAEQGGVKHLNQALADVVQAFVEEGLQAYVHKPSGMISMGAAKRSAIDKGGKVISGAIKVVINQFFGSLTPEKLQAVARYIDDLTWPQRAGEPARLIFTLDSELHLLLCDHLVRARKGEMSEEETAALTASLQRIVDTCILHYYQKPADLVELKGFSRSVTSFGIGNVEKAFDSLLGRLLSRLEGDDLVQLAAYLESLLHQAVEEPAAR